MYIIFVDLDLEFDYLSGGKLFPSMLIETF